MFPFLAGAGVLLWVFARMYSSRKQPPLTGHIVANVLIVRRALTPAHYFFLRAFAQPNGLRVMVDRRIGERRRETQHLFGDRRCGIDRRQEAPATWHDGDFVVPRGLKGRSQQRPALGK
jgi:hypothetical protein